MNDISVTLSADDRALLQALREAGVSLDQFARKGAGALRDMETASHASATGIEKLAGGLKTAFIGGGVAAAIITIKNAIGGVTMAMIDAQMQADKVKNSLAFAMGGAQAAQEIQYLRQVTDQLGVSFAAVAPMYGRLAAATKGTNLEGRATREIFESIAQASVVMGLGVEETEGAMRALVQMVSKGQIQAEELRGQLGERLPRAFQIFADSMGVTTGELSKLLEAPSAWRSLPPPSRVSWPVGWTKPPPGWRPTSTGSTTPGCSSSKTWARPASAALWRARWPSWPTPRAT